MPAASLCEAIVGRVEVEALLEAAFGLELEDERANERRRNGVDRVRGMYLRLGYKDYLRLDQV